MALTIFFSRHFLIRNSGYLAKNQNELYKSYCATMEFDDFGNIKIDDHIYGFLNLVCDDKFYHLYLEFNYSKDYDEEFEDFTMLKISIGQFSKNEFILIKNEPFYSKNDLFNEDVRNVEV